MSSSFGIRDNRQCGNVGDLLLQNIAPADRLAIESLVSTCLDAPGRELRGRGS